MTSARQIAGAAAVLLAVVGFVLPPRADGTIPKPECRTAALLSHSAPLASSQSALDQSSPAAVLTQSEAAASGMCRNDPVNNFDPLGLVALGEREADVDLFPVLEPTRVEDDLWVPQVNSLIRGFNRVNAAGNMAIRQFDAAVLSPYRGAMLDAVDLACVPLAKVDDACVYCFDVDSATLYMTARSIHPYAAAAGAVPYALGRVGAGVRSAVASLRLGGRAVAGQQHEFIRWWASNRPLGSTAGSIDLSASTASRNVRPMLLPSPATSAAKEVDLLGTARDNLLNAAENPKLRDAIHNLYRPGAKVGSGSSMDAYRFEQATGQLLSPTGHGQKLLDRRTQLQKLVHDPNLSPSDRQITKDLLIDIQNALGGQ